MSSQPESDVTDEFEIRPLHEDDLAGISELITGMSAEQGEQLRLRDKSSTYYHWMYLENPAGQAIVHSAHHRGSIVSSFAIAPKRVRVNGREVIMGKTMDMFTRPDYQGMGLIKRCTDAVFRDAAAAGMVGWYVTPSVNSYPIFKNKWKYREEFRVVYRARVLDYASVLGAAIPKGNLGRVAGTLINRARRLLPHRGRPLPNGYELSAMDRFGEETDRLWGQVANGYRVALVRDAAYLNWRYIDNPDEYTVLGLSRNGTLVGIVVLATTVRRGVKVGELVDFVCSVDDEVTFRLLVKAAAARAEEQGCALVEAWSIIDTSLDSKMRRAGLRLRRRDMKLLISPEFPDPEIYDGEAWLLTQGDGNDV